jgi:hypothetical protein
MSDYNPDKWVMLKFTHGDRPVYKILASWYGGYARGDSWQLNSGVVRIEEDGQCYLFHGASGSVYCCHKATYGMSAYTMGILANFQEKAKNADDITLELLPEDTNFMEIDYGV